jgi:hypothetical protein
MPCCSAFIIRRFGTPYCLHFQGRWLKNKYYVIYRSDGRWNGQKRKEKTMKNSLKWAVLIVHCEEKDQETEVIA